MESYRRHHPRVLASLPARLELPNGRIVHATTVNLSRAGFQIATDGEVRCLLFRGGDQPAPRDRVPVTARLLLAVPGAERQELKLGCVAVFARRTAERRYHVGLQFSELPAATAAAIDSVLEAVGDGAIQRMS